MCSSVSFAPSFIVLKSIFRWKFTARSPEASSLFLHLYPHIIADNVNACQSTRKRNANTLKHWFSDCHLRTKTPLFHIVNLSSCVTNLFGESLRTYFDTWHSWKSREIFTDKWIFGSQSSKKSRIVLPLGTYYPAITNYSKFHFLHNSVIWIHFILFISERYAHSDPVRSYTITISHKCMYVRSLRSVCNCGGILLLRLTETDN